MLNEPEDYSAPSLEYATPEPVVRSGRWIWAGAAFVAFPATAVFVSSLFACIFSSSDRERIAGVVFAALAGVVLALEFTAVILRRPSAALGIACVFAFSTIPVAGNLVRCSRGRECLWLAVGMVYAMAVVAVHLRWWFRLRRESRKRHRL